MRALQAPAGSLARSVTNARRADASASAANCVRTSRSQLLGELPVLRRTMMSSSFALNAVSVRPVVIVIFCPDVIVTHQSLMSVSLNVPFRLVSIVLSCFSASSRADLLSSVERKSTSPERTASMTAIWRCSAIWRLPASAAFTVSRVASRAVFSCSDSRARICSPVRMPLMPCSWANPFIASALRSRISRICLRESGLMLRSRSDTSTAPSGASPSSLRTWSIAACPTPLSESARTKASLMARTSVCEIDLPFHPVKTTWLFSRPRVVSLVSVTSPALYVPDDIF